MCVHNYVYVVCLCVSEYSVCIHSLKCITCSVVDRSASHVHA